MKTILELAADFDKLMKAKGDLTEAPKFKSKITPIADDINFAASKFLQKLKVALSLFHRNNPDYLEVRDGRAYVKGENRKIDFDYNSALEIAKQANTTINDALKNLNDKFNQRDLVRLGVALNTFYDIIDHIKKMEDVEIEKERQANTIDEDTLAKNKAAYQKKVDNFNAELTEYFESLPKDVRSLSVDEAYENISSRSYKFNHQINLGYLAASYKQDFIKYLSKLGYQLDNTNVALEFNEGKNVFLLEAPESYLKRNMDFEDALKELIFASFINFETSTYQVAFIEGEDGEVILGPIADFLKEASKDLVYNLDVADNKDKAMRLIRTLNDEVRNRIRTFKTTRYLEKKDIAHYNAMNSDNPYKYILLVIKDFPSGFENAEMRDKLENIIADGAATGVSVLIIGENKEVTQGLSSKLPPIMIPSENIIKVNVDKSLLFQGSTFHLLEPKYKFDDIELLRKRIKNASNFSLSNLLEEKPSVPHYEEVAIPLGKCGSDIYSLVAGTERPPYPFVLVTGQTGTGKSAFMHEIILSGAYKYSPDELEFHVIDFKSADTATEFSQYEYGKDLYIPHIKYLSLKSRPENALDIISYIQKLKSKRNRLGKYKEYNQKHPEKKMPLIYVIIDEYESMLAGGENAGNDYESIALQSSIQDGITKILKTARAFGIGVIFSGQAMKGLPSDAFAQLSTIIAFNNKEAVISKLFPGQNINMDVFPSEDYRGLAYTSSNSSTPKFTKFAWVGNEQTMKELAKTIRNKYPEHTKLHIQSIIGGTSSAEIRLDSFLPWKEEINNRLLEAETDFSSKEQFLSSKQDKIIKHFRPLGIGQSSSSEATVYLDYQKDENGHNFYAFGRSENLCIIERNAILSFLFQVAELQLSGQRVILLDGSNNGVKKEIFSSLLEKYPFISKQIEYINEPVEMARKLLSLSKHLKDNPDQSPYFIVMHEIDWLNGNDYLPKIKENDNNADASLNADISSSLSSLESSGVKVPAFLMGANFSLAANMKKEEKKEFDTFTTSEVRDAFKNLYLNGLLKEHFMLVSSIKFENINSLVINLANDSKAQEQIKNYAIYGSYEMFKNQDVGDKINANICYVFDGPSARSTTRLFDYEAEESKSWWERLEKMMFYWR